MARRRWYKITLNSPLVFSRHLATTGQHETLDYIPGSVLLGLAAALYERLEDDAWTVFHSGAVRFGDGLPIIGERKLAIPSPLCIQTQKRSSKPNLVNQAARDTSEIDESAQYSKVNAPYLVFRQDNVAIPVHLAKTTTMKTAMDSDRGGTPKDAHLFGYQALSRGQQFLSFIDVDEGVCDAVFDQIEESIVGHRRLGASRSAEFGAVEISRAKAPGAGAAKLEVGAQIVRLILTSDLALYDENGVPRLTPKATDFGLPQDWVLDLSRTFLRHRRYDRFNSYRRSYDIKRHIINRGGVLTFRAPNSQGLNEGELKKVEEKARVGAGLDRQLGLGQYLLEPVWIDEPYFVVPDERTEKSGVQTTQSALAPDPELLAFISSRTEIMDEKLRTQLSDEAEELARFANYHRAPSKSQWSRISQWARVAKITHASLRELVGGTQGQLGKGWQLPYRGNQGLGDYLVELGQSIEADFGQGGPFLSELARLVRLKMENYSRGGASSQMEDAQ